MLYKITRIDRGNIQFKILTTVIISIRLRSTQVMWFILHADRWLFVFFLVKCLCTQVIFVFGSNNKRSRERDIKINSILSQKFNVINDRMTTTMIFDLVNWMTEHWTHLPSLSVIITSGYGSHILVHLFIWRVNLNKPNNKNTHTHTQRGNIYNEHNHKQCHWHWKQHSINVEI